ncbi:lectin-like protein At1g53070 [Cicer arietinum]|uniref:Lectin-like protein At1g53070 n=1 Tax=Cicer arietinum TaxID=3827 RepID=A0A1S2YDG1_CICAR|nr:lectin-like protein At1g53070 [Cicer arietinum]
MVTLSLFVLSSLILFFIQPSFSSSSSTTHSLINIPNFDNDVDLFGDAKVFADKSGGTGTHVKLTHHSSLAAGLLLRRQPIIFTDTASFSVEFTFSISPDAGGGLLLIIIPGNLAAAFPGNGSYGFSPSTTNSFLGVEFDTSKDDNVGDLNANHVGIDFGSLVSVAVANVSDSNMVLNSGKKLKAWVDYEAGSHILEVRLNKWNEDKSLNPIVSHNIDLFKIWGSQPVYIGLSSSNDADSVQVVRVYSWKLNLRNVSTNSLHSQPVDPNGLSDEEAKLDANRKFRPLTLLAGVIFGTVCVVLVTFVVLFMWVIFFHKYEEESLAKLPEHPSDVRYERIDVAVDKNAEETDQH